MTEMEPNEPSAVQSDAASSRDAPLDAVQKEAVRKAFSRAAKSYDAHAEVQAEVERRFLARVEERFAARRAEPLRMLEIGCGTGKGSLALVERFPHARLLALDFCPEMVACARQRWNASAAGGRVEGVVVDAETFTPKVDDRFDLLAASGVFQWFADLRGFLRRAGGWLAAEGELHFALFGARTFYELNETLAALDRPSPHAPTAEARTTEVPAARFATPQSIAGWLKEAFHEHAFETVTLERNYPDLLSLLRNLHHTGTHGRQWRGSLSPGRLRRWEEAYRARFGAVRATYEIHFGAARRPRAVGTAAI